VKLSRNKTTFKWQLKINGVTQDTSDLTYVLDTWYHVGIDIKYNDTTGWAYVYVDGVEDMTFSGNTGSSAQSNAIFGATDGSNPGICTSMTLRAKALPHKYQYYASIHLIQMEMETILSSMAQTETR
jgi:hypothetical protein